MSRTQWNILYYSLFVASLVAMIFGNRFSTFILAYLTGLSCAYQPARPSPTSEE